MSGYPPNPTHFEDFSILLKLFRSMIPESGGAIYVSAPVTSGPLLTEWYRRSNGSLSRSHPKYDEQHKKKVIEPNLERAALIVRSLRNRYPNYCLIDPTTLDLDQEGWNQDDYRYFWGEVIKQYAAKVVFVEGWQHSAGCAYEFLIAQRCNIEALNEQGSIITVEEGTRLLRTAAEALGSVTDSADFVKGVLQDLSTLTPSTDGIYA